MTIKGRPSTALTDADSSWGGKSPRRRPFPLLPVRWPGPGPGPGPGPLLNRKDYLPRLPCRIDYSLNKYRSAISLGVRSYASYVPQNTQTVSTGRPHKCRAVVFRSAERSCVVRQSSCAFAKLRGGARRFLVCVQRETPHGAVETSSSSPF